MNKAEQLGALETYVDLMSMNGGAYIFHTARHVGIFNALGRDIKDAASIAEMCGLKEKPTQLLLEGLCGLKVVKRKGRAYALTPVMMFLSGNYQDLSNSYWNHLEEYLKSGVPMAKMDDPQESEKQYQAQVTALDWMMRPSAEVAACMLGIGDRLKGLSILDVGAGSGVWSLTFARKDPSSSVTALDWPSILNVAQAAAEQSGMADRFATLPGNYHDVELPDASYDLIIVANVTHIETEKGNKALFQKLYRAIKPGGIITIFDVFGGHEKGTLQAALYALGLALRTEQGQVYSPEALQSFLADAGFKNFQTHSIEVTPYTMGMLIAHK